MLFVNCPYFTIIIIVIIAKWILWTPLSCLLAALFLGACIKLIFKTTGVLVLGGSNAMYYCFQSKKITGWKLRM